MNELVAEPCGEAFLRSMASRGRKDLGAKRSAEDRDNWLMGGVVEQSKGFMKENPLCFRNLSKTVPVIFAKLLDNF